MLASLQIATFTYFAIRISTSDILLRTIRNIDLGYFLTASLIVNNEKLRGTSFVGALGVVMVCLFLHFAFRGKFGIGDLKLFIAMGAWAPDFLTWFHNFGFSWSLGGIFAVIQFLARRKQSTSIPFAPFIFLGFFSSI